MSKKKALIACIVLLTSVLTLTMVFPAYAFNFQEFEDVSGESHYNYCPSYIQTSSTVKYMFYCRNKYSGVVNDSVYWRKATWNGSTWVWGSQNEALSKSSSGWDSVHVCDPEVRRGSFNVGGHNYSWVMFYLGTNQTDYNHNQIGVAFADNVEGPWVKWSGNPLITFSPTNYWGVGQPSATSVDGAGSLLLFYTRCDVNGWRTQYRYINISNMNSPSLGTEADLFTNGLTEKNNSAVILNNASFAYEPNTDRMYLVRERHPYENVDCSFISADLQVAYTAGSNIWNNSGSWTLEGNIDPDNTGKLRNHNPGFLTNPYGVIQGSSSDYWISYSVANTGSNNIWSYRIFSIHKSDLNQINKVDDQNQGMVYTGTWSASSGSTGDYYMGTSTWSNQIGAAVQLSFRGSSIYYYGGKAWNNGKAKVYIDNVLQTTIDTYDPGWIKSTLLYSKTGMTYGNHTIKIEIINDKNPSSSGYNKDVDYFKVG